ncbi:hypothetical protein EDD16DRAFT_316022 [Pisolithus croceorrhizus]|nr:hypothetical protein EDD16DRAFT_316022 [Pisolithus croceorrhizus]
MAIAYWSVQSAGHATTLAKDVPRRMPSTRPQVYPTRTPTARTRLTCHCCPQWVDYLTRRYSDDLEWLRKAKDYRKLYTVPGVGQITVIKATAAVAGVKLEEPVYKHYEDDEMPEFPAKFPCGRIPAFEGAEGFNLTEGAAIARYKKYLDGYPCQNSMSTDSSIPDATILVAENV